MTYPTPMDVAESEDRMANSHDFECEHCRQMFYVAIGDYDIRWDHPPGDDPLSAPTCPSCADKIEAGEL